MLNQALAEGPARLAAPTVTEEALRFGPGGRLLGILTLPGTVPAGAEPLPVFVFLSAGLLHRVGPRRLHVDLARKLAQLGFPSIRVDQSGIGDSPMQTGLPAADRAVADFREIVMLVQSRLGSRPFVLGGLCAGADTAIFMANAEEAEVVGLFLLDPVNYPNRSFRVRSFLRTIGEIIAHPVFHTRLFVHRVKLFIGGQRRVDQLALRDWPTLEQTQSAMTRVAESGGQVISVFTRYSLIYYNKRGEFGRALNVAGYKRFATELFWPTVNHVFPLEVHRARLIGEIERWARNFLPKAD